jgi:hypothetical protein
MHGHMKLKRVYCLWYNALTMLPAGGMEAKELPFHATRRQHRGYIIPQVVNTV